MDQNGSARVAAGVIGGLLLLLGLFAFAAPVVAGLATNLAVGGVLVAAGVLRFVYAARARGAPRAGISALLGVLSLVAGVLLLVLPLVGLLALTLVFGGYLVVHGALESYAALKWRRRTEPWGWLLVGGLAALVLGAIVLIGWPITGLFAIGVITAVHLLVIGSGLLAAAIAGTGAQRRSVGPTSTPAPA